MHPHHRNLLPSTVFNMLALVNIISIHTSGCTLSISVKPRSATHFPTSTTSTGLQCLLVSACVHLAWFRAVSHHLWPLPCVNIFHASRFLVSLGGHQLEPCSPKCEHKFASVVTESSSVAMEMREGSNVLSYQWVYLWFEMPACSWHGAFTVYNHKVKTSWDKPSIKPLRSAENELEPSRCVAVCCLIS